MPFHRFQRHIPLGDSKVQRRVVIEIEGLAAEQGGVLTAAQLRRCGVTWSHLRANLAGGRWRRVHPGVYAVFTGPLPDLSRVWAAVLSAGPGAAARHETAAWLWGLRPDLPPLLSIAIPHGRPRRTRAIGVRLVQSRRLPRIVHAVRRPPATTLEDTVLDIVDTARVERAVIDVVLRACQLRLTSPRRLAAAARQRGRLRWRGLTRELLDDVRDGVTSPLERRYVHDVERAHGLPRGVRNRGEGVGADRRYRDVRYRRWRLVVELDGRAAHPEDERERDDLRDNEVALRFERSLRFGWRSVTGTPCHVARQVGAVLTRAGWPGSLGACGPTCDLARTAPTDALTAVHSGKRIR